jgi:competence protein ComEC
MPLFAAFRKIPFARFLLFYITGIILAMFTGTEIIFTAFIIPGILIVFTVILLVLISFCPNYNSPLVSGILVAVMLLMAGWINLNVQARAAVLQKSPGPFNGTVLIEINDPVMVREKSVKSQALIRYRYTGYHWQKHRQEILVYLRRDSASVKLLPGDFLIAKVRLKPIPASDPGRFNYKQYLAAKRIYYRTWLPSGSWKISTGHHYISLKSRSLHMQQQVLSAYGETGLDQKLYSILCALTIGYKNDLDKETKHLFSEAGVMHVMALSGFNVVVIAMVFTFLLSFCDRSRTGNIFRALVIVLSVWLFSFITGLSPSVTRAAAMITLVICGKLIHKQIKTMNILFASAFVLLTVSPLLIADVSFQLSFAAVLGIVFYQPVLSPVVRTQHFILSRIWQLFTVSSAAQLGTFPLTLYYFHQFPVYFWLTNLYVVPLVSVIICVSGIYLVVFFIKPLALITGKILWLLLVALYQSISFVEVLPFCILQNIHISLFQVVLLVMVVLLAAAFWTNHRPRYLVAAMAFFAVFEAAGILQSL